MIRYTYAQWEGNRICFYCDNKATILITDRKTGDEYPVCKEHSPEQQKIRKINLHPDFLRANENNQKQPLLNEGKVCQNASLVGGQDATN